MDGYAPDYGSSAPPGALDFDLAQAYALALRLHEGRLLAVPKVITVPNPPAGLDWTTAVPGGVIWIVQTIRAKYNCSAVAGNREPALQVLDGTSRLMELGVQTSLVANNLAGITWARGIGTAYLTPVTPGEVVPFPTVPLTQNLTIKTVTQDILGADQWNQIVLNVIEIRERTPNERAQYMEALTLGQPTTDYPGLLLGL